MPTVAYILMRALRQFGLQQTEMAQAQCDTIRVKLLKIGATVKVTVRRVCLALSEACPFQDVFRRVCDNLRNVCTLLRQPTPAITIPPDPLLRLA
jgi:hypothetical protein